jgi:phosphoribosyl-dephospho-CoA transferase
MDKATRRFMPCSPGTTHDLIRPLEPIALTADAPAPSWLGPALQRAPWVVIRRGPVRDGVIPVGARGSARHQRFAAFLAVAEIAERLSPEDLVVSLRAIEQERRDAVPALAALARVAPVLARSGSRWGPGGSVGFEIATGVPTATWSSDLDLILRQERRIEPKQATDLLAALVQAAAPTRIDVMLETPTGGVSLADLTTMRARVLVRTPCGPRLSVDPWTVEELSQGMRDESEEACGICSSLIPFFIPHPLLITESLPKEVVS